MSIGLQRKKGAANLATGRSPLGRARPSSQACICWPGWLGQASWVPGQQHRPTGAREQRASPALALATGPSLATTSMVQRAIMRRVTSRLRRNMPMRLRSMSHTGQHASNTDNRPSLASTNNGEFGLFFIMPHEHGRGTIARLRRARCTCLLSMSHAEKAWQLRAPRRMCPFACSRRTPSLALHCVTMTGMLHVFDLQQHADCDAPCKM